MQDLILGLKKSNDARSEKRQKMMKITYYDKLFKFIESRFSDGETFTVKNYFEDYKMVVKDNEGNDKTIYGLICDNNKSYLGLNDLAFPKRLYKREIKKVDGVETTSYIQLPEKVFQGDLAILFDRFKSQYKDALIAFDLLYLAIAKHNESTFVSESFIYPTETFQRFKGEYTTSNFYLFNFKAGGTDEKDLQTIFESVCKDYENSLKTAEASAEYMNIKQINISLSDFLSSDIYQKEIPLIKEFGTDKDNKLKIEAQCEVKGYDDSCEIKEEFDIKPKEWCNGDAITDPDAIKVIENTYGNLIDECLKNRDYSMPVLAIGLPFSVFGNRMVLKFVKSSDENDIEWRFYYHYSGFCLNVLSKDNASIRRRIIKIIYDHFYESRFKKNE